MLSRRRATAVVSANWWDGGRLEHLVRVFSDLREGEARTDAPTTPGKPTLTTATDQVPKALAPNGYRLFSHPPVYHLGFPQHGTTNRFGSTWASDQMLRPFLTQRPTADDFQPAIDHRFFSPACSNYSIHQPAFPFTDVFQSLIRQAANHLLPKKPNAMLSRRRAATVVSASWWDGGRLEHLVRRFSDSR